MLPLSSAVCMVEKYLYSNANKSSCHLSLRCREVRDKYLLRLNPPLTKLSKKFSAIKRLSIREGFRPFLLIWFEPYLLEPIPYNEPGEALQTFG